MDSRAPVLMSSVTFAACILATVLVLPTSARAQTSEPVSPVSLDRIRLLLSQEPPTLHVPAPSGDRPLIRMEIQQRVPFMTPVHEEPFDPTYGLPSIGELVVGGVEKVRSSIVNYKHGRAQRRARQEVQETLAEFCKARGCTVPAGKGTPQ